MEMFNNMFGKVASGMCRLAVSGGIAVKTADGYKSYNLKNNRLTNCNNFVFNIGEEFFFVIPTNKVEPGDIILVAGKPKCVISVNKDTIKVIDYEDSTVKDILPERHVFMGNTYFYGKIVSMFGNNLLDGKKGINKMMSYMMMSEIMKSSTGNVGGENNISSLLLLSALGDGNGFTNIFDGMFGTEDDENEETSDIEEDKVNE